jgi:hypothetical protein
MRCHDSQPVNAAEPHQIPAHDLLTPSLAVCLATRLEETPLFDEVGLAIVAQCILRCLGKPKALKYLRIPHQVFRNKGEECDQI